MQTTDAVADVTNTEDAGLGPSAANHGRVRGVRHGDDSHMLDVLILLARHKFFIFLCTLVAAVLGVIYSLVTPNIYTGRANILPPQESQSISQQLMGQLGPLAGWIGGANGLRNPNDIYLGMLRSRTLADILVLRFNLREVYRTKTMADTRQELADLTKIQSGKDGIISIEVQDRDAYRSAELANAYIEELSRLSQVIAVSEASKRRLFFEQQLKQAKDDLSRAEVDMKKTEEQTGLIHLGAQAQTIINSVATVKASISAREVRLKTMLSYATESNPEIIRLRNEIAALRSELYQLEEGTRKGRGDIQVATGNVPEVGLEYARKLRDVKYYETLFEVLARQYEIARIDESKSAAVIQILDKAILPERRTKPKRTAILLLSALAGFWLGIFWILFRTLYQRMTSDPAKADKWKQLLVATGWNRKSHATE